MPARTLPLPAPLPAMSGERAGSCPAAGMADVPGLHACVPPQHAPRCPDSRPALSPPQPRWLLLQRRCIAVHGVQRGHLLHRQRQVVPHLPARHVLQGRRARLPPLPPRLVPAALRPGQLPQGGQGLLRHEARQLCAEEVPSRRVCARGRRVTLQEVPGRPIPAAAGPVQVPQLLRHRHLGVCGHLQPVDARPGRPGQVLPHAHSPQDALIWPLQPLPASYPSVACSDLPLLRLPPCTTSALLPSRSLHLLRCFCRVPPVPPVTQFLLKIILANKLFPFLSLACCKVTDSSHC